MSDVSDVKIVERPILFSGEMVKAIIDGRKTQTRRSVKFPDTTKWVLPYPILRPPEAITGWYFEEGDDNSPRGMKLKCPYGVPGDRLWVREMFRNNGETIEYKSGGELSPVPIEINTGMVPESESWRPSIHMPRWASRLTLKITAIRVERLQDISEEDAKAEGAPAPTGKLGCYPAPWATGKPGPLTYRDTFKSLWESINGMRKGCAWNDNPWVWVIEFRKL